MQLLDLRSKVCSQACAFVILCVQKYGLAAESFADKLISKESLLKLLSNGNKVLAEAANETIQVIISCISSDRYLNKLIHEMTTTKNICVREKLSACLITIISEYDNETAIRNVQLIEKAITMGVIDSSA
jgi:hypothetical protein